MAIKSKTPPPRLVPPPPVTMPSIGAQPIMQQSPMQQSASVGTPIDTAQFDSAQLAGQPMMPVGDQPGALPSPMLSMTNQSAPEQPAAQPQQEPDFSAEVPTPDNTFRDTANQLIQSMNTRRDKGEELENKMLSFLQKNSAEDRGQQKATEIFGNLIAPALGLFGGPAAAQAGVMATQQAQQEAARLKQSGREEGIQALKFMKEIHDGGDKEGLQTFMSLMKMQSDQRAEERQLQLARHQAHREWLSQQRMEQQSRIAEENRKAVDERQARALEALAPSRAASARLTQTRGGLLDQYGAQDEADKHAKVYTKDESGNDVPVASFNAQTFRKNADTNANGPAEGSDKAEKLNAEIERLKAENLKIKADTARITSTTGKNNAELQRRAERVAKATNKPVAQIIQENPSVYGSLSGAAPAAKPADLVVGGQSKSYWESHPDEWAAKKKELGL